MGRYDDYQALHQPTAYRSFGAAIRAKRGQFAVLAALFVLGVVITVSSSGFAGGLVLIAAGLALIGTLVAAKYQA